MIMATPIMFVKMVARKAIGPKIVIVRRTSRPMLPKITSPHLC